MKYILYAVLAVIGLLLLLLLIALLKTLLTKQKVSAYKPKPDPEREKFYAEKLSKAVQCETVSHKGQIQREKFLKFHEVLAGLFPLVHQHLEKTEIDGSLLYFGRGEKHDKPVVLMAHQDVVPAEGEWLHGHFSGDIDDGKVWGRGAADDKSSLITIFQAVEELLADGYVPAQDVYISSSNTEEIGEEGCPKLVAELKRRGVTPFLVNDEGGTIVTEPMAGIPGNFAMIGILEKGMGDLLIKAKSNGGHSSYPPKNSPIARLSKLVCDIEKHYPMKSRFSPQLKTMLSTLGAYGPFYYRLLFGNLWLFKPLLTKLLPSLSPQAGALMRTTIAPTMQSGSNGCNVLPQEATLNLNLRYIPHQDMEESNEIIRKLAAKYDLEVEIQDAYGACKPIDTESEAFRLVEETIREVFPGLPIVPYVMTGGTDAKYYEEICPACVRFAPLIYGPEQMKGMHGLNETMETVSLPGAVDYYKALIRKNK